MSNEISASELKGLISKVKIIDIRDNYQYNMGSIPTSVNIPAQFLLTNPDLYLQKDNTYYIYCEYGKTSISVGNELRKRGYNIINVTGGYNQYKLT